MINKILIMLMLLFNMGCYSVTQKDFVLFDFESDSELDRLQWSCHTLPSLSNENVTHGKKSLKLELYPSGYPGLTPVLKNNNWQGYESLAFDIYNPEEKEVKITIRLDDREVVSDYSDRYNHGFLLVHGLNRMNIPLNNLITSGTNRKLNLKKIQSLIIFMASPPEKVTLYVDYIRLQGKG